MADRKKRDRYAGAAYEFGANAGLNQGGGAAPPQPAAPGYGAAAPGYGAPAQGYGQPSPGYGQPAAPGYGQPAYGQPPAQDPNALGQQFGQMNLGPQGQGAPQLQQQQQQQPATAASQNQLFPSDLIAQPFHVSELYNPPPPINLPANAAATPPSSQTSRASTCAAP